MIVNYICIPGNDTATCSAPSNSITGLAVGLTSLFVLLLIGAGVIVYKYHSKMRSMLQFEQRRSHKKQNDTETPPEGSNQYVSLIREQPTGQNPVYENLPTRKTGYTRPALNKLPRASEEDVYLQCDSPDDAIYSNDPACNLSILSDFQEEDVYIVPDSS
ncbi:hypothetical protein EYF80_012712 [Liparis tanakae]|uniref:Uncharacterized protein n=1 Tax=Liparis tanakae TaxID=230148 RepID=A0A4Z2IHZ5_9TELE|nr:hypothetical protein EYF80_012712 [Liparis tanakae]